MQHSEIIKQVQNLGHLGSREAAEKAVCATLETLAERIQGDAASHLAAQLPQEFAECLQGHQGESGESFSLHEFYERVCQREGVELPAAIAHTQAVFKVLKGAITPGEFSDLKDNFSEIYEELFAMR